MDFWQRKTVSENQLKDFMRQMIGETYGTPKSATDGIRNLVNRARELGEFALEVGSPGTSEVADVGYARLRQNYPNPFNPTTTIEYEVETSQHVRITINDVSGRYVATLLDAYVPAGIGSVGMLTGHMISRRQNSRTPLHVLGFL